MDNLLINKLSEVLKENTTQSISDILFDNIREMILSGELEAGFAFPNETELCKELNIGRGALREAYKALDTIGFISRSKAGTTVNDITNLAIDIPLNMNIEKSDIKDVYEFRKMLEAESAAYAAKRCTKQDILNLTRTQQNIIANLDDKKKAAYFDTMFHCMIAQASQNKLLTYLMKVASSTFEKGAYYAYCNADREELEKTVKCHEQIIDAIASGDMELARKTMREHVNFVAKVAKTEK